MKKILVFACLLAILGGCTSTKGHKDEQKNAVVGEALAFLKDIERNRERIPEGN